VRGRIAVNASIVGDRPTGLGTYAIKLLAALDEIRDDVVVYTSAPASFRGLRSTIRVIPAATRPDRGMRGHLLRIAWLQTTLRMELRRTRPRAVLNAMPEGIIGLEIPQVTVLHDLLPLRFPPEYPRQQYYFRHFVPRILRASSIVVASSQATVRDAVQHYDIGPSRFRVVYPGYDPAVFSGDGARPSAGEPYVLFVSNLLPHKNVLRLLDAFAIVRRRHACRLVVRGDGRPGYVRAVRERISALGLDDAVTFPGYLDEPSLRQLYRDAVCSVLPSLGEGFGLTILESMACGTPVIAATGSSLPEVAADAALMIDPYDVDALANAMSRMLTDEELCQSLRRRGLERVRQFSWRRTAEAVSRLLDAAASAAGTGRRR
jgi:glycosyltransferase involved in cell wall biosynthesis